MDTTPAVVAENALAAIPFDSLIGSPLDACINAQAKAALTSWNFIKEVGLYEDSNGVKKAVNVEFSYNKNGELVVLNVPILTIVPIPFLAVDKVEIDFIANISASASTMVADSDLTSMEAEGKVKGKVGIGPFSLSLDAKANYSSKKDSKSSKDSKYSVEYTMNVHVEASQADMPAGLGTILNILSGAATESPVGGDLSVTPKAGNAIAVKDTKIEIFATIKDQSGLLAEGVEVSFIYGNVPDLTFSKPKVSYGKAADADLTEDNAKLTSDSKGRAGIVIEISDVTDNFKEGNLDVKVTSKDLSEHSIIHITK